MGIGCRASAHNLGFTLIELLVAMVILAITAVLVFDGMRLGTRSWALVDERADKAEQMRLAQGFTRAQLEQAQAFASGQDAGTPQLSFLGEANVLRWVAPFPSYVGQGGMYWFTLEEQEFEGRKRLVLSYELFQPEGWERFSDEKAESVVLHENIEQVEFAYLDVTRPGAGVFWESSWKGTDKLPALIRMRLRPKDARSAEWPQVLVAPKAASGSGSG